MPKQWRACEAHYLCQVSRDRLIAWRRALTGNLSPSPISVGPVSSLHDRACELFYLLVGGIGTFVSSSSTGMIMTDRGIVDYGEQHSKENAHERLGRTYETGLYPEWSVDRPLHFLGHSIVRPI